MITDTILQHLHNALEKALITDIPAGDPTRAGAVKIGALQGEPDVDEARISVEIYANDPDRPGEWEDEIIEFEIPRTAYWARRFAVSLRCLLVDTGEPLNEASRIASTLKARIEETLLLLDWTGVVSGTERAIGVLEGQIYSLTAQSGGPGEYDWSGKFLFEVQTRNTYL